MGVFSCIREILLSNESFAPNLQHLQQYPKDIELVTIIHKAIELRDGHVNHARGQNVGVHYQPSPSRDEDPSPSSFRSTMKRFFA